MTILQEMDTKISKHTLHIMEVGGGVKDFWVIEVDGTIYHLHPNKLIDRWSGSVTGGINKPLIFKSEISARKFIHECDISGDVKVRHVDSRFYPYTVYMTR